MRMIVDVSETEVSESSDDNEDDGAEPATAEAVWAAAAAGVAAAAEAAEAADVFDDPDVASYDYDSTESLHGWEDENGEELGEWSVERDGNNDTGDGQQEGDGLI